MTLKHDDLWESLTNRYKQHFKDLVNEKIHPEGCNCWLCLYRKHQEITARKKGRRRDPITFLLFDLIDDIKSIYLIERGIAKKTTRDGKEIWEYPFGAKEAAPYRRKLKEILNKIPGCEQLRPRAYREAERMRFLRQLDELYYLIYLDQQKPEKKSRGRKPKVSIRLIQDISDFIYSRPEKKASQREILRKFTTVREAELKELQPWLQVNHGIYFEKEGRSPMYYGELKDGRGRYFTMGPPELSAKATKALDEKLKASNEKLKKRSL